MYDQEFPLEGMTEYKLEGANGRKMEGIASDERELRREKHGNNTVKKRWQAADTN